jgi:transcriptional regulator with XRE-family HTH domain
MTTGAYIGQKIGVLVKREKLRQYIIAEALGLTRASVQNIIAGRQNISLEALVRVCSIFSVTPNDIFPPIPKSEIEREVVEVIVTKTKKVKSAKINFL